MVASRPIDVSHDQPRMDPSPASPSSPSPSSPSRPLLPAERDINAAMNGFNAGVVNMLKGKCNNATALTHFVVLLSVSLPPGRDGRFVYHAPFGNDFTPDCSKFSY